MHLNSLHEASIILTTKPKMFKKKRKLQTNNFHGHRSKNSYQNSGKTNLTVYKENYTL